MYFLALAVFPRSTRYLIQRLRQLVHPLELVTTWGFAWNLRFRTGSKESGYRRKTNGWSKDLRIPSEVWFWSTSSPFHLANIWGYSEGIGELSNGWHSDEWLRYQPSFYLPFFPQGKVMCLTVCTHFCSPRCKYILTWSPSFSPWARVLQHTHSTLQLPRVMPLWILFWHKHTAFLMTQI